MAEEKKEDEKLLVVTDDPKDLADVPASDVAPAEGDKDKKAAAAEAEDTDGDADDDAEGGDERHGHAEGEDGDRTRDRKSERQSRKQRQREARERQQRELGFLRKELDRVDHENVELRKRQTGTESREYDGKISELDRQIREAEQVMKQALDAKNSDDHVEAMRLRDTFIEAKRNLTAEKEEHEEQAKEETAPRPKADPQVVSHGQAWLGRNPWFKSDANGRPVDQNSRIARAIDSGLVSEGFDPRTEEYWEELDKRVSEVLPDLTKSKKKKKDEDEDEEEEETRHGKGKEEEKPKAKNGKGGPMFRVGGRDRPLKSNEVYLPKARIEALKEAGIWDDPVERERYLKAYKNYDTTHTDQTN